MFAHRVGLEHDAIAVVHEPIEDGVGDGAIPEIGMPLVHGELTGHDGGASVVAIIEDLEQIAHRFIAERREAEVIDE